MSLISSSHPRPNPKISQPSNSTTKPRNKYKNKKSFNWLELPEDVWSLIISKLPTIHIIENVQSVCMLFRQICNQPSMFKIVDMTLPKACLQSPRNNVKAMSMTRLIVDRSGGCLEDIYLEWNTCDDATLMYIVERSQNLKHLRLGHNINVSRGGLIEAIERLPVLEEVEIIKCLYPWDTIAAIGHACPFLKSLSLNDVGSKDRDLIALAIAKSMPNLHHLRLIGSWMTNEGLKAVLDGCPRLESLDLGACFRIDLSGDLGNRCEQIKHLQLPFDSTADYSQEAYTANEEDLGASLDFDGSHLFGIYNEDSGDFEDGYPGFFG